MDVLGDAVARDRRSDAPALAVPSLDRTYDYRRFCTGAWKVGHLLRHHGVRAGDVVVVADEPRPPAVLSLYGAATLGAVVQIGSPGDLLEAPGALVAPTDRLEGYPSGASTTRIAYGGPPTDPAVVHFERDAWSENPTEPPDHVDPGGPLLATSAAPLTHDDVLRAARGVVEAHDLGPGSRVAVAAPFAHPGATVAGLVAPILAGGAASVGPGARGTITVGPDGDIDPEVVVDVP